MMCRSVPTTTTTKFTHIFMFGDYVNTRACSRAHTSKHKHIIQVQYCHQCGPLFVADVEYGRGDKARTMYDNYSVFRPEELLRRLQNKRVYKQWRCMVKLPSPVNVAYTSSNFGSCINPRNIMCVTTNHFLPYENCRYAYNEPQEYSANTGHEQPDTALLYFVAVRRLRVCG